jgi:hypothetical protein
VARFGGQISGLRDIISQLKQASQGGVVARPATTAGDDVGWETPDPKNLSFSDLNVDGLDVDSPK